MKKKIALLTAFIVALYSLCAFSAPFSDMPEEDGEYYDAARYAVENGIISGDGNALMLASSLTRAQAAVIAARAASLPVGKTLDASDVESGAWYYCAAAAAVDAGFMALEDGKFLPNEPFGREEAFILLEKIYDVEASADLSAYTDLSKLTPDGRGALSALVGARVVKINGSAIEPAAPVTRGEFVLWLYNAVMLDSPEPQRPTQPPTEATDASDPASEPTDPSEATEPQTQPDTDPDSAAEAARALEIMRVSLGIRSDGTSYTAREAYHDYSQEMNDSYSSRSSSSGGSSRPTSPKPTNPKPTEPPTEKPTNPSTPTEPKTEPAAPTEPDGGFDNDKDNTVDDPFDDDWKNPGGGDGEDEEFFPNDDDDPEENPTKTETPSESESGGATEPETPSESESDSATEPETPSEETPSEPETGDVTEPETPSEETSSEPETENTTEPEDSTEEIPSDPEKTEPEEPSEPPIDMDGEAEDESGGESAEEIDAFVAAVFKAWWFI